MQAEYKTVRIAVQDGVAALTLDNPPVNQMSPQLSRDLALALTECFANAEIKALILTGAGKNFVAGADITELQALKTKEDAFQLAWTAAELFNSIEASSKPVIAAINGNCLGGGLELALACHYRVAAKGSHLGLPEVQIGVIPGAGGIQRLPRLIGLPDAVGMIPAGQSIPAEKAVSIGLLDELVSPDLLLETCRKAARRFISGELDRKKHMSGNRKDRLPGASEKKALIEDFKTRECQEVQGYYRPLQGAGSARERSFRRYGSRHPPRCGAI